MAAQVEEALEAGADGIVIGALTPDGDVDLPLMERLVSLVESFNLAAELLRSDLCHAANDSHFFPGQGHRVSLTFHRAFDRCRRPFDALEQIIGLGCDRILTSGQAPTAEAGAAMLRELRRRARGRIGILPGGGVTPGNAARILAETGCAEIHASASVSLAGKKVTDAGRVAEILQAING
jgi:copper homeostasis protein